ncbi:MAG: gliding motility-associated C-terminal domain-containing protein [Bacteroidetes bacterium]|nr:gliding motility-associated C-terminal domain-containing protein [Bacteroidota bacterium]
MFVLGWALWAVAHAQSWHPAHEQVMADAGTRVTFIPNAGQWESPIRYQADVRGGRIWLEEDGLRMLYYDTQVSQKLHNLSRRLDTTVTFAGHVLRLSWVGGQRNPSIQQLGVQPGTYNYFLGDDPGRWQSSLLGYTEAHYKQIYPNVDLQVTGGAGGHLKYNLVIRPGARLSDVRLRYEGAQGIQLQHNQLQLHTCLDTLVEHAPETYQITAKGIRQDLPLQYILHPDGSFGFEVPAWDGQSTLYIDPELVFSTYTGSFADNWGMTATYDAAGALYSGGVVQGPGYPTTTGAIQLVYAGGGKPVAFPGLAFNCDIGITKFSANGTQRLWATYLGGRFNEFPASMIVNEQNELYVLSATLSDNFPVRAGSYDITYNGSSDITISKINATGTALLASTYLGGAGTDGINMPYYGTYPTTHRDNFLWYFYADDGRGEIILDNEGNVLIASSTASADFPVATRYGSSFGGGDQDGIVAKLDANLSTLLGATYIPGNRNDAAYGLKVNSRNEVYVTGGTLSSSGLGIPATAHQPGFAGSTLNTHPDGYLLRLSPSLDTLLSGTYAGTANAYDQSFFIELDSTESVYIFGQTQGAWPIEIAAGESSIYSVANSRQFIARYDSLLQVRLLSTRWGTAGNISTADIAPTAFLVDACGNIYCTGWGGLASSNRYASSLVTYGRTNGLPHTADAYQGTTDNRDFYLIVFDPNARALQYATFFGENTGGNPFAPGDHVDGGTCRFDKTGRVYHAVCASCTGTNGFPTTAGVVSRFNNSTNCNNAAFKFSFDLLTFTEPEFEPRLQVTGCAPFPFLFENNTTTTKPLTTGTLVYEWDFGDTTTGVVNTSTLPEPTHEYQYAGIYRAKLIARVINEGCALPDSTFQDILVFEDTAPEFEVQSDSCSLQITVENQTQQGTIFRWHFGEGPGDTLRTISTVPLNKTYTHRGNYTITLVVNPGTPCSNTQSTQVFVGSPAEPQFTATPDPCLPRATFTNTSLLADEFRWQFSTDPADTLRTTSATPFAHTFSQPGTYPVRLVVNPGSACPDSLTQQVTVGELPDPDFAAVSDSCTLTLVLENRSTGLADAYHWRFSPAPADTLLTHTLEDVQRTYVTEGLYDVTLTVNPHGDCPQVLTRQVVVAPRPTGGFTWQRVGCGRTWRFTSTMQDAHFYNWILDGQSVGSTPQLDLDFTQGGTYTMRHTASSLPDACYHTVMLNIPVTEPVTPAFQVETLDCSNTAIFNNTSTGHAASWFWEIDGVLHNTPELRMDLDADGTYAIRLTLLDSDGCVFVKDSLLNFMQGKLLYLRVPNVFSPNNDGINDRWEPETNNPNCLEQLSIFNRWGVKIFETAQPAKGWDGRSKHGTDAPEGAYVFVLRLRDGNERSGTVTLIR